MAAKIDIELSNFLKNREKIRLNVGNKLKTISLNSRFTGSPKEECISICLLLKNLKPKIRGGQYRGTVTRYFFSTVIGNVSTFSKKYRFWYRRYFL